VRWFIIFLLTAVVYANSLFNPFIWDDVALVAGNPFIKNWRYLGGILTSDLFHSDPNLGNYYRPLQAITYVVDYAAWKLNPLGYHLTNILLHFLAAGMVYLVLNLFINKRQAFFAALLFAIHPLHTEAVAYIAGRADSLAAIFLLCALWFYARGQSGRAFSAAYLLSLCSWILALLSKEIGVIFPLLVMLYDIYFRPSAARKKRWLRYAMYLIILAAYIWLRTGLLRFGQRPMISSGSFLLRTAGSLNTIPIYLLLFLFPFNLHMERWIAAPVSLLGGRVIFSAAISAALCLLIYKLYAKQRKISFCLAWFVLLLIPVMGIFIPAKNIIMAEHWLYLPGIGIFALAGIGIDKVACLNRKAGALLFSGILLFYSLLTVRQNAAWKNPRDFYQRIIRFSPQSSRAHFNLAAAYEEAKQYVEAEKEYLRALEMDGDAAVYNNLGNVYFQRGELAQAVSAYQKCIQSYPRWHLPYNNLGNVYLAKQEIARAQEEYQKSIALNPRYSESRNNLGLVYLEKGDLENAGRELRAAIGLDPENSDAYNNLGSLYAAQGLLNEAVSAYQKSLRLNRFSEKAHFNLGIIYFQQGLAEAAKAEWKAALQINPRHTGARKNLEAME
jgi:tetratricopeptide (TPR) repeat protein